MLDRDVVVKTSEKIAEGQNA